MSTAFETLSNIAHHLVRFLAVQRTIQGRVDLLQDLPPQNTRRAESVVPTAGVGLVLSQVFGILYRRDVAETGRVTEISSHLIKDVVWQLLKELFANVF